MTDTGQIPGEGLPESAGMVEQPGVPAHGAYTYLSEPPAEDEDLLLPGAQGAWGNEVPPPAPEPVVEAVHQPGAHEAAGRDSGSVDLGGVRLPDPGPASVPPSPILTGTHEQSAPVPQRRPLHLGPPIPDASASPVRSLADRGPAGTPVRQPAQATTGLEYLDVQALSDLGPSAGPWGAATPAPAGPSGLQGQAAETVVPDGERSEGPAGAAQAAVARLATEAAGTDAPGADPTDRTDPTDPTSRTQGAVRLPQGGSGAPVTPAHEGAYAGPGGANAYPAPGAEDANTYAVPGPENANAYAVPGVEDANTYAVPGAAEAHGHVGLGAPDAYDGSLLPQDGPGEASVAPLMTPAQGTPVPETAPAEDHDGAEAAPGQVSVPQDGQAPAMDGALFPEAAQAPVAEGDGPFTPAAGFPAAGAPDSGPARPHQPGANAGAHVHGETPADPQAEAHGDAQAPIPGEPRAAVVAGGPEVSVDGGPEAPAAGGPQAADGGASLAAGPQTGGAVNPQAGVVPDAPAEADADPQASFAPVPHLDGPQGAAVAGTGSVAETAAAGEAAGEGSGAEIAALADASSTAVPADPATPADGIAAGPDASAVDSAAAHAAGQQTAAAPGPDQTAPVAAGSPTEVSTAVSATHPQDAQDPQAAGAPAPGAHPPADLPGPAGATGSVTGAVTGAVTGSVAGEVAPVTVSTGPVAGETATGGPQAAEIPVPHTERPEAPSTEAPAGPGAVLTVQADTQAGTPAPAEPGAAAAVQPGAVPDSLTESAPTESAAHESAHPASAEQTPAVQAPGDQPAADQTLPSSVFPEPQPEQSFGRFVPVDGTVPTSPHLAPTPPQPLILPTQEQGEAREAAAADESPATVPAPREAEPVQAGPGPEPDPDVVQQADDLDTRAADPEDGADARHAGGPAAPGYQDAEREAVLKVMRERRDIRNGFRSDPIPHEVLLRVLEAAHTAPSVGHSQPWDFVVIRSADTRRAMHELAMRQRDAYAKSLPKGRAKQFKELKIEAILDTPVNIVVTADPTRGGRHTLGRHTQPQMAPYSSALAVENLWLAARAEGLGVGWVSFFDEREMVRSLGLPEHLEVVAYLCVGYVDEFPEEPELMQAGWSKRRPLSWVVHEETYGRRALPGEDPHDLLAETVAGIRPLDAKALGEAWERQKRMTKPAGALGMLEIISAQLSGLSRQCPPPIPEPAAVAIFAGDHGVHAQGVTPWPQEVTAQMVANFLGGGAVCNAFAAQVGAEVCVVDVGVATDLPSTPGLLPRKVRAGTSDMTTGPAMTREEAKQAIEVGIETARDLVAAGNKALLTGEMGIANTTASAALISVFTGADPAEVTGRGTGINDETLARKTDVVRRALEFHQPDPADPIGVLAAVGGFEHAAMVGLLLGGASLRTPVILDGVSAGAAALVARAVAPEVLAACIAGHRSAEPGHVAALNKLGLRPLVDLDLRLGEGTGALLALPLVQSTARAMHEVATFDSAGVTEK